MAEIPQTCPRPFAGVPTAAKMAVVCGENAEIADGVSGDCEQGGFCHVGNL